MLSNVERRPYGWERRAVVAGTRSHPLIRGMAIVFNERSVDLGGFKEVIRPEAMKRTLDEGIDLRAFFDHDPAKVLGRMSAGTLTVESERRGLMIEIDPPVPTEPANLMQSIERGDITGMSFSFAVMPNGDEVKREGGEFIRYVNDMRVYEVSVVSLPAYEPTHVAVGLRSVQAYQATVAPTLAQLEERWARKGAAWK